MLYEWKIKHICAVDRWPPWRLWTQQSHRLQWRTFSTSSWNGGTYFTSPPPRAYQGYLDVTWNLTGALCSIGFLLPCSCPSSRTPPKLWWTSCPNRPRPTPPQLSDGWVDFSLSPVCLFRVHFLNCSKDWFKFCICRSCHAWPLCWGSRTCLSGLTRPLFRRTTAFSASQCTASPRSVSPAHSDCLRIITC